MLSFEARGETTGTSSTTFRCTIQEGTSTDVQSESNASASQLSATEWTEFQRPFIYHDIDDGAHETQQINFWWNNASKGNWLELRNVKIRPVNNAGVLESGSNVAENVFVEQAP